MHTLEGGGLQRIMLRLAGLFAARGHRVDLVVCKAKGAFRLQVPAAVRLVPIERPYPRLAARVLAFGCAVAADPPALGRLLRPVLLARDPSPWFQRLPALTRYLRQAQPHALLSAGNTLNCVALLARRLAGTSTRLVVSERDNLSVFLGSRQGQWRWRLLPPLIARTYPWADAIVAVSDGVADDLARTAGLPRERITTIYNPALAEDDMRPEQTGHPWFAANAPPVVLGAGRLEEQKDFPTLLRAFARVRRQCPARLIILGEGRRRAELEALAARLQIGADVELRGWVDNPYGYMRQAAVFVLSSIHEGLPNVLLEALACGCPVVSTDCPSGPAEILARGRYGALAPVGDDAALAQAILATLAAPPERAGLRARAGQFSAEAAVERYLEVLLGPCQLQPGDRLPRKRPCQ